MVIFPEHMKVNVPAKLLLPGECRVAVRIKPAEDWREVREHYGKRLVNWEIGHEAVLDPDSVRSLQGHRVRVVLDDCGALPSSAALQALGSLDCVFLLKPGKDLVRDLNFLTALGLRVHVDASAPFADPGLIAGAADFYLHNPLLATPVEPFHSVLSSMTRRRGFTLWEIEGEDPKSNCHVDDSGAVSLGNRWTESTLHYGTLSSSWDEMAQSSLLSRLLAFRTELFRQRSSCVFCPHFEPCAGFLRAIDPDWPCEPWQQAFSMLGEAVREAVKLQAEVEHHTIE